MFVPSDGVVIQVGKGFVFELEAIQNKNETLKLARTK